MGARASPGQPPPRPARRQVPRQNPATDPCGVLNLRTPRGKIQHNVLKSLVGPGAYGGPAKLPGGRSLGALIDFLQALTAQCG